MVETVTRKQKYETDIKLGERYRDEQTGITGVATGVQFYQYGCERVTLETVVAGKIEEYSFDAPRLKHVDTGKLAETSRTGGPGGGVRSVPGRGLRG